MYCQCGCGNMTRIAPYSNRSRGWVCGQPIRYLNGHNRNSNPRFPPSNDFAEIGWAAGLYEGEGSFYFNRNDNSIYLRIGMTDRWPLDRFRQIVGAGSVCGPYGPYSDHPHWSPQWAYSCNGWQNCAQVVNLVWDFLSPRRQKQIEIAVERYRNKRR
jgi:hypothetical protein